MRGYFKFSRLYLAKEMKAALIILKRRSGRQTAGKMEQQEEELCDGCGMWLYVYELQSSFTTCMCVADPLLWSSW